MIKTKKQMFIVIGAFLLTVLLGTVTYAFFNYTRTGTANTIRTGRIAFNTTQSSGQNGSINLTNVFPVDVSEGVPSNNPNVGEVTINITGDTEYTGGIEYIVTAANVTNTIGGKVIPIGVNVIATSGLGTSDEDYFDDRENNPESSIYKVLAGDTITNNEELLVGYIKSGQTGINGNVVVKAYIDASKVAISDTYYENVTVTPTPTAPTDEYGTPSSFGDGRIVLTTDEWNSIQTNGISFQVKVEAREDVWVTEPLKTATFDVGSVVNTKMKLIVNGGEYTGQDLSDSYGYQLNDIYVLSFNKMNSIENIENINNVNNIVSSSESENEIYMWKGECNNNGECVINWYSTADVIYLNADSSSMFKGISRGFTPLSILGLGNLDTSNTINMSEMFMGNSGFDYTSVQNWNVSNVTNMSSMFKFTFDRFADLKDASSLNGWDVRNVTNFTNMFMTDDEYGDPSMFVYPVFTLRPGTWDNTASIGENNWDEYAGTYIPNS